MSQRLAGTRREAARSAAAPTRRSFLQKTALVGSAIAVVPKDYLLRPGSAYAALCACGGQNCACGSLCCDGYTEFCCTMTGAERLPARHDRRRVVEGRRVPVLQRPALLHRLQRDVPLRGRAVLPGQLLQLPVGLRLRAGRLQQPQGRVHAVPLRAVQPARRHGRAHRVPGRLVRPGRARRRQLRTDARGRQLDREPQQAVSPDTADRPKGGRRDVPRHQGRREQHDLAHQLAREAPHARRRPRSNAIIQAGVTNGARRRSTWPQAVGRRDPGQEERPVVRPRRAASAYDFWPASARFLNCAFT